MIPPDSVALAATGRLLVVTFLNGVPKGGIAFQGPFGVWLSKSDGTILKDLEPGQYQALVPAADKSVEFTIVAGEETQISVQIFASEQNAVNADIPLAKPVATERAQIVKPKVESRRSESDQEDVVVLAPRNRGSVSSLIEVRKKSTQVTDVLGSEQMARAGDSDAASSLRRVTGLTLMDGKYVYVRGLGERYSAVQMNGFGLPSPEPTRRVVPLDLFPTAILESVVVQKSYSANQPGEFGGGLIQLSTKSIPDGFFFKSSISVSIEEKGKNFSYAGGSMDWLGVDDGSRALPAPVKSVLSSGAKIVRKQPGSDQGLADEQLVEIGRSFKNEYKIESSEKQSLPNLSLAIGDRFKIGSVSLGTSGSLLYGQDSDSTERSSFSFTKGATGLERDSSKQSQTSEINTRLGASFDLGADVGKFHKFRYNTFLLRHTTKMAKQDKTVTTTSPDGVTEKSTLDWTERQLWTHHLTGHHDLSPQLGRPYAVDWRLGIADSKRDNPDRREYAYDRTPSSYQIRSDSNGNRRTFSFLTDTTREVGLDFTFPLSHTIEKATLKVGTAFSQRERRADVYRFTMQRDWDGTPPIDISAAPEEQFQPGHIGAGLYLPQNLTDSADSYSGEQSIQAYYGQVDWAPFSQWAFQAGARMEESRQSVKTFSYFSPSQPFAESELVMKDVLPVYSATWKPSDRLRARLAYSETLARPEFREMSTVAFLDDETDYIVQGNESLKGTVIHNYDHRWEYYWAADESVSLGGFYKKFESPVEVIFIPGVNRIQSFDNAKGAANYGIEFETRAGLRHVSRFLRRWTVGVNRTWIQSEIELDERNRGTQTSNSRPLQGQSPFTQNIQLQYDRPLWGFSGTILFNSIGRRISEVGTNGVPDTYEESLAQLDLVLNQKVAKNWSIGLKAKNLLDPIVESRQDNEVVRSYRRGRSAGLGVSGVF